MNTEQFKNVGRNDPCPCGSGKKFKRCHADDESLNESPAVPAQTDDASAEAAAPQFDPSKMDLNWLAEFSSALQRLPKGQLQQLQSLMKKGMMGKDVSRELEDLQKRLPPSVQALLKKSPELEAQLENASANPESPGELTDEQKEKLHEIQKNNEKSGLSRLWSRFRKK